MNGYFYFPTQVRRRLTLLVLRPPPQFLSGSITGVSYLLSHLEAYVCSATGGHSTCWMPAGADFRAVFAETAVCVGPSWVLRQLFAALGCPLLLHISFSGRVRTTLLT